MRPPSCQSVRACRQPGWFGVLLALLVAGLSLAGPWRTSANPPAAEPAPTAPAPAPESAAAAPEAEFDGDLDHPLAGLPPKAPPAPHPLAAAATNTAITWASEPIVSTNLITHAPATNTQAHLQTLQFQFDLARQQRLEKNLEMAKRSLVNLLETNAPPELKRKTLLEMALVCQDTGEFTKAQQTYSVYRRLYPEDPSIPEVLLRQGLLYRQMGVSPLAISKFYAVMTTALSLKLDRLEYYRRLVLQAQTEIADTYYLDGKYGEAVDFYQRLLKQADAELNRPQIQYKHLRCLVGLGRHAETHAQGLLFLDRYPEALEVPEVRFLTASALQAVGRSREAMGQVLLLLQAQQSVREQNPETWTYWQQRAGNEIANQFYKEADYLNALQIYLSLAQLDKAPAWQVPVWYQIGLVYERLQQPPKATETYARIVDTGKTMPADQLTPGLSAILEMARWRQEYIQWRTQADQVNRDVNGAPNPSTPPLAAQ